VIRPGTRAPALLRLLMAGAALTAAAQFEPGQTAKNFRFPDYDKDGRLKSQVFGEYARVLNERAIEITNLKIEVFRGAEVDMIVTSPLCLYDRIGNSAASTSSVRIARGDMVISGTGFSWDAAKQKFVVERDARVVVKGVRKTMEPAQ
jgi:hypothetical protein